MGHGHFSPTATQNRFDKIIESYGWHVDITEDIDSFEFERRHNTIKELFTNKYNLKPRDKWLNRHEKLIAETRHGVELREIHHPSGTTVYYYIVVTKDTEWCARDKSGLAMKHATTYRNELKQALIDIYGDIYTKTSAWTSQKVNA